MLKRSLIALLIFPLAAAAGGLQAELPNEVKPEVRLTLSKTVLAPSDTLNITLQIKGVNLAAPTSPRWPKIPGCILVDQTSSVVPFGIGGKTYSLFRFVASYVPLESGITAVPAIEIRLPDFQFRSKPMEIKILNADGTESPRRLTAPAALPPLPSTQRRSEILPGDELKLLVEASTATPYLGEQVLLTYKLLTTRGLGRKAVQSKKPDFKHFWAEQLAIQADNPLETVVKQGITYYQIILERTVLFPLEAGRFTIEPASWKILGDTPRNGAAASPDQVLSTEPLEFDVRPLPPPPAGTRERTEVGTYQLGLNFSSARIKLGQAFPLYLTIKGSGNIRGLMPPEMPLDNPDFNIVSVRAVHASFQPFVDQSQNPPRTRFGGEKIWEILLYPKRLGRIDFPAVAITTFNPDRQEYVRQATRPVRFDILEFAGAPESLDGARPAAESAAPPHPALVALLAVLAALLAVMTAYGLWARRRRPTARAHKRRPPTVEAVLKEAEEVAAHRGADSLWDLLTDALNRSIQEGTGVAPGALVHEELRDVLRRRGLDADSIDAAFTVLGNCDEARFAGVKFDVADRTRMLDQVKRFHEQLRQAEAIPEISP
jgi:hypothetical protein